MNTIYLIGAGLFNIICSRILAKNGYKCIILEKRKHIGGNCYDEIYPNTKILNHVYGPHIIHSDNYDFIKWLSDFDKLDFFHHEVKTKYKNKLYSMPINLSTINDFFDTNLNPNEVKKFLQDLSKKYYKDSYNNMEEKCLSLIGMELYEAFFKTYTYKQWNKYPIQLPSETISRIPIRTNYQTSYYKKKYSFIPHNGYTELFKKILKHENISIELNKNIKLKDIKNLIVKGKVIYTGAIDELFEYEFGELEYRSLYFEVEKLDINDFQGISVINYPELEYNYTRITEAKHFYPHKNLGENTIISKEYSTDFKLNSKLDRYYPINTNTNNNLYAKYLDKSKKYDNLYIEGRLGKYIYTDMENTFNNAILFLEREFKCQLA
ncbi:UDP-galactopyranose mutase [Campylobacter sp. MG1]|uniref:UDP-galactopyranose mutase n=1 Tax=Campylobacter sp. MG1 TaxID=2976332 RepID=UPI00226CE172|nr:UDP-galactopyranose mutase [Campylobacter sp. MG1]